MEKLPFGQLGFVLLGSPGESSSLLHWPARRADVMEAPEFKESAREELVFVYLFGCRLLCFVFSSLCLFIASSWIDPNTRIMTEEDVMKRVGDNDVHSFRW